MTGVKGQLTDRSTWVYLLIFLVLLAVALIIQGATVQKIGFGPISVEFDKAPAPSPVPSPVPSPAPSPAPSPSPSPLPSPSPSPPSPSPSSSSSAGGASALGGVPSGSQDFSGAKSVTGSWKQRQGKLTLEVTQVDNQDGLLRLHVKAINESTAEMTLPLLGYFTAVDNAGQTHDAGLYSSKWHESVPSNEFVTGTIDLIDKVANSATRLRISFSVIFGSSTPDSGITVREIPIPH